MFAWKTLLSRKLELVVSELETKKKKIGLSKSRTRSEGPAKIEQTLELISTIFETMVSCDPELTPPPDVSTELTSIISIQTRKLRVKIGHFL